MASSSPDIPAMMSGAPLLKRAAKPVSMKASKKRQEATRISQKRNQASLLKSAAPCQDRDRYKPASCGLISSSIICVTNKSPHTMTHLQAQQRKRLPLDAPPGGIFNGAHVDVGNLIRIALKKFEANALFITDILCIAKDNFNIVI